MMLNKLARYVDPDSVFLYQMGKVGSSSLERSIDKSIHFHTLYNNPPNPPHLKLSYPFGFSRLKYLMGLSAKRKLIKMRKHETKIISLVRCPYERNMSMFFQALPFWMALYYSGFGQSNKAHSNRAEGMEVLWDCFSKCFNHTYPINWFEKELSRFTGIDFYYEKFDKKTGAKVYSNEKFSVLVLKASSIDNNNALIEDFLGRPITLELANSGDKKWYAGPYKDFKEAYASIYRQKFPDLASTKYYQNFIDD